MDSEAGSMYEVNGQANAASARQQMKGSVRYTHLSPFQRLCLATSRKDYRRPTVLLGSPKSQGET